MGKYIGIDLGTTFSVSAVIDDEGKPKIIKDFLHDATLTPSTVYSSNGKKYVGSATGENMLWGRWKEYIANGNGGNIELKNLDFSYIQKNFRYSILEIYKSTTDDDAILERESWWKELLMTRQFGYNKN